MGFPAFKEWHAIVEALHNGEQTLILRKGGIAEGRGGFQLKAERFWLLPTSFHLERSKLKPSAEKWLATNSLPDSPSTFAITTFAEVVSSKFLADWDVVEKLDRFHFWSETTVRERFDWSKPPGLHAFIVRAYQLHQPFSVDNSPALAGCKSWVELPNDSTAHSHMPAVAEGVFKQVRQEIESLW